ncbi:Na+/H+ antiporter NhaC [Bacilliculturomica massiliensis]|uniref:Na+/H+ antiporter NhaC n=1 Tax=Bacilliculturomica massiliensis TaxID=1917867 RepID=UPI0010313288|nr:Na+/H+ antiporter NhaC [Bacilliculturomica massiliensis]
MGKDSTSAKTPRQPYVWEAIVSFAGLIIIMSIGIIKFQVDPHIPMFIGVIIAALMSLRLGYKWSAIEEMMITGISRAMQAILILSIVGMMVGVWLLSGTIPTMIYFGLKLLSPSIFLIASVLICSITSLATGTSWGTMGTMGLALMGIAQGLGMPVGPTAGAILAGAYFGDKLSPLSDTTNLAPAMAGTDVFTHVKYMIKATAIAYAIALIFFGIYGFQHASSNDVDTSQVTILMDGLKSTFNISPILLLPPLVVILAIALKIPAIPGITLGVIVGAILVLFQGNLAIYDPDTLEVSHVGATLGDILVVARNGFVCNTEIDALNDLLSTGGLMNMASSILMTVIAMMFGGIMEGTKQLEVLIEQITKVVKSGPALIGATEVTCLLSNITMPEQYISILVPGRMYASAYRKAGIHPKSLSNALESAGTVTSPLVPWNTCGMYIAATLGVTASTYAPWAVFNYAMPIVTFLLAFVGVTVTKMTPEEQAKADAGELV